MNATMAEWQRAAGNRQGGAVIGIPRIWLLHAVEIISATYQIPLPEWVATDRTVGSSVTLMAWGLWQRMATTWPIIRTEDRLLLPQ